MTWNPPALTRKAGTDPRFIVGLDLGKANDPTALAVAELVEGGTLHLRHLERARLGTSYTAIVGHVSGLMDRPQLQGSTMLARAC